MKLLKFNFVFVPLVLVILGGVAGVARQVLQANAREQVTQIARLMMETASSSRIYTTKQVAPLLQHKNFALQSAIAEFQKTIEEMPKEPDSSIPKDVHYNSAKRAYVLGQQRLLDIQRQFIDSVKSKPEAFLDTEFHPQSVPAFAATEISHYLKEKYPDFDYKEATLNPTSLRDRTTDWEADIVNQFRSNPKMVEFIGSRQGATGPSLILARPLRVNNVSCLTCHSSPDKAPPEMIKLYGPANGFGWKLDEIIGAQVVTVPTSLPVTVAESAWNRLLLWLGCAFVGLVIAGNLAAILLPGVGAATAAAKRRSAAAAETV